MPTVSYNNQTSKHFSSHCTCNIQAVDFNSPFWSRILTTWPSRKRSHIPPLEKNNHRLKSVLGRVICYFPGGHPPKFVSFGVQDLLIFRGGGLSRSLFHGPADHACSCTWYLGDATQPKIDNKQLAIDQTGQKIIPTAEWSGYFGAIPLLKNHLGWPLLRLLKFAQNKGFWDSISMSSKKHIFGHMAPHHS